MRRIERLSDLLANQIAAGEVVERPASVVKELIENSIDAHATRIEVQITRAGANRILVRDNGVGIDKEDLPLVFARHATSKIRTSQDLFNIQSLGFRGEALASIASCARCVLKSKSQDSDEAWELRISPTAEDQLLVTSLEQGTSIEVLDLFYNMPVRRKFLKSEKTESLAIEDVIKKMALANRHVHFSIQFDDKAVRYYPACKARAALWLGKIVGQQFAEQALEVNVNRVGLSLTGWVGKPDSGRRQADIQYLYVNQRIVKDKQINHAIKQIYAQHPRWQEGAYPAYILYLNLDAKDVDVNVHPTKQEVRFTQSRLIYDFFQSCLAQCFQESLNTDEPPTQKPVLQQHVSARFAPINRQPAPPMMPSKPAALPVLQIHKNYVCYERACDVVIINIRAAYDKFVAGYFSRSIQPISTKALLFPQQIAIDNIEDRASELLEAGWMLRQTAQGIEILQQPSILSASITEAAWHELLTTNIALVSWLVRHARCDFSQIPTDELVALAKAVENQIAAEAKLVLKQEQIDQWMTQERVEV